jgi:hypothetical protein
MDFLIALEANLYAMIPKFCGPKLLVQVSLTVVQYYYMSNQ